MPIRAANDDAADARAAAIAALRAEWGEPPAPRDAEPARPGLSVRGLTKAGFGDQLLLYGIARMVADRHGLAFEAPDWIGRDLFGFDDPLPAEPARPPVDDAERRALAALQAPAIAELSRRIVIDGDLDARFHGPTARWAQRRDDFRALFDLAGAAASHCDLAWNRLANQGYLIVAIDPPASGAMPLAWYETWLDAIWPDLPGAALYVAGGEPAVLDALARFDPVTADDIADPLPGAATLVDFVMMTHADILGIGGSSFAFVASLLNSELKRAARPDPSAGALVPYDPWNAPVVLGR